MLFLKRFYFLRFKENHGLTVKRKIQSLLELEREYDAVFNCTGLAAKYLCKDPFMVPIRGQIVKVNFTSS